MTAVTHVNFAYDVYIGRECKRRKLPESKWANPFHIGRDGTRAEVIQKYRNWIIKQPDLLACLHELKDKRLGCWCHPKECHGHFLAALTDLLTGE